MPARRPRVPAPRAGRLLGTTEREILQHDSTTRCRRGCARPRARLGRSGVRPATGRPASGGLARGGGSGAQGAARQRAGAARSSPAAAEPTADTSLAALRAAAAAAAGTDTSRIRSDTAGRTKFVGRERSQPQLNPEISATGDVRAYGY